MTAKPKTGEKRKTRQPLKMDKLPSHILDRVMAERSVGRTWEEIEDMSPRFEEWNKTEESVRANFPGLRLPHSTLQRWYDLRVEQVKREVMAQSVKSREFAAAFAKSDFRKLPEAVKNALGDQVFALMQHVDEKNQARFRKELLNLGMLLAENRKLDIQERRASAEVKRITILEQEFEMRKKKFDKETSDAARKLGKGKAITEEDINRIRERTFGLPPIQRVSSGSTAA